MKKNNDGKERQTPAQAKSAILFSHKCGRITVRWIFKHRHGEAEVLDYEAWRPDESQLLTNAERVNGEVIVNKEVLNITLYFRLLTLG